MLRRPIWLGIACALAQTAAPAQTPAAPANSLVRARALWTELDRDRDGRLSAEERARLAAPSAAALATQDLDRDGLLSADEFVLGFRELLRTQGQLPAPDLEAEVARLQALRRAAAANAGPAPLSVLRRQATGTSAAECQRLLAELERALLVERPDVRAAQSRLRELERHAPRSAELTSALAALENELVSGGPLLVVKLREVRRALTCAPRAEAPAAPRAGAGELDGPRQVRRASVARELEEHLTARSASAADFERLAGLLELSAEQRTAESELRRRLLAAQAQGPVPQALREEWRAWVAARQAPPVRPPSPSPTPARRAQLPR